MARRRQTTGLPKKDRQQQSPEQENQNNQFIERLLGYPKTRVQREEAINRLLQRSVLVIGGVFVGLIALVLFVQFVITPNLTIATVNGERITVGQFQERFRFEQALTLQQATILYQNAQQQAQAFGVDVNQILQNNQQFQQLNQELQFPDILGQRVLDQMIEDELIRQELEERNITVNEELIEEQQNEYFGFDPTEVAMIGTPATETPTPTITPTPFVSPTPSPTPLPTEVPETTPEATAEVTAEATGEATAEVTEAIVPTIPPSPTPSQEDRIEDYEETVQLFRDNLIQSNATATGIDNFFFRQAQQQALLEAIVGDSTTKQYVNARHILVETEEEANEIIAALEAGESFAELARSRSIDTTSGARGGELDWAPVVQYVPEFQEAVLNAPIGEIVGPVESEFGFHIIQVRAREEREVEGDELQVIQRAEFSSWMADLRDASEEDITINDNWPTYLPN
jgi:parvulin-like peptidyl-prolyl isomerase